MGVIREFKYKMEKNIGGDSSGTEKLKFKIVFLGN